MMLCLDGLNGLKLRFGYGAVRAAASSIPVPRHCGVRQYHPDLTGIGYHSRRNQIPLPPESEHEIDFHTYTRPHLGMCSGCKTLQAPFNTFPVYPCSTYYQFPPACVHVRRAVLRSGHKEYAAAHRGIPPHVRGGTVHRMTARPVQKAGKSAMFFSSINIRHVRKLRFPNMSIYAD